MTAPSDGPGSPRDELGGGPIPDDDGPIQTTGGLLRMGTAYLLAAGSETPRLDAELLLGHVLEVGRTVMLTHPEAPVGADAARRYQADLERRAAGEPVAYLRGLKEFFGLAFEVDARALIPRPETERLVELAIVEVMRRLGSGVRDPGVHPLRIVDVGTGSGVIAIALAVSLRQRSALDEVDMLAVDISPDALDLARENAVAHAVADQIRFVVADLLPGPAGAFDLVLANLPYVKRGAIPSLPKATGFEPILALDGGPDGLEVIGRLLDLFPDALAGGGVALLEIGADQGDAIAACIEDRAPGWRCEVEPDLAGLPRVARVRRR